MSKINFVRASLTKTQYSTTFVNKTKKKSINREDEKENYVLTTQSTPVDCITAQQDFNYFLAKGCRKNISVDNCQIGFPFTNRISPTSAFQSIGNISYTVQPGKITRSEMVLWGRYIPEAPLSSTTYSLAPPIQFLNSNTTYSMVPFIEFSISNTTYSF